MDMSSLLLIGFGTALAAFIMLSLTGFGTALATFVMLLLFGFGIASAVFIMSSSRGSGVFMSMRRQPRARPLIVRILCGLGGLGLLAAVGIASLRTDFDRRDTVSNSAVSGTPFVLRTKTVEPPRTNWLQVKKIRLMVHLVAVEASASGIRPLHNEWVEVRWPQQKAFARIISGYSYYPCKIKINSVYYSKSSPNDEFPKLYVTGEQGTVKDTNDIESGAWNGGFTCNNILQLNRQEPQFEPGSRFSLNTPRLQATRYLLLFVTPVAEDDSMVHGNWNDFVKQEGEQNIRDHLFAPWSAPASYPAGGYVSQYFYKLDTFSGSNGGAWWDYTRTAGVYLIIAAVLLTQLFTRRMFVFPAVLAAVVVYTAVIDRSIQNKHLAVVHDPQATPALRLASCDRLGYTFFWKQTAIKNLQALARASETPDNLRYLARSEMNGLVAYEERIGPFSGSRADKPRFSPVPVPTFKTGGKLTAFSPDGKYLAISNWEATPWNLVVAGASNQGFARGPAVQVWDLQSRTLYLTLAHADWVNALAFSPDGKQLVSSYMNWRTIRRDLHSYSGEGTGSSINLWDMTSDHPRLINHWSNSRGNITSFAFSPDGRKLFSYFPWKLWDVASISQVKKPQPVWTQNLSNAAKVILSPDQRMLALIKPFQSIVVPGKGEIRHGGAVELWGISPAADSTPKLLHQLPTELASAIRFSPDGKILFCAQDFYSLDQPMRGKTQAFDVQTGRMLWTRMLNSRIESFSVSPDGKMLACTRRIYATAGDSFVRIELCDTQTGRALRAWEDNYIGAESVAFSPDSKQVAFAAEGGVHLIDINDFWALPQSG